MQQEEPHASAKEQYTSAKELCISVKERNVCVCASTWCGCFCKTAVSFACMLSYTHTHTHSDTCMYVCIDTSYLIHLVAKTRPAHPIASWNDETRHWGVPLLSISEKWWCGYVCPLSLFSEPMPLNPLEKLIVKHSKNFQHRVPKCHICLVNQLKTLSLLKRGCACLELFA